MKSIERFYVKYWSSDAGPAPEHDPTTVARERLLLATLRAAKAKSVLDAGCGSGYFLASLREGGFETAGIDIADKALRRARERLGDGVRLYKHQLDSRPWPVSDEAYDAVWSSEVIEHIYGIYEYGAEASRVLKPGGLLILTTPYHGLIKNLALVLFAFDRHFTNIEGGHIRFFTRAGLRTCLRPFGFTETYFKRIGRIPPLAKTMFIVLRKRERS